MKSATLTQLSIGTIGVVSATCFALSSQGAAQALTFAGNSSGQFNLPLTSPPTAVISLSNETGGTNNRLTWGMSVRDSFSNFVQFDGLNFSTPAESVFNVGTLTYRNGTTDLSTSFDGDFPLSIALNFTTPGGINKNFNFLFNILNTPNTTGDPVLDGDRLQFSASGLTSDSFSVGGINYTLRLLGFSNDGGASIVSQFNSPEGATASASLYGQITTETIPTPALLPGLIGFGLGIWRKRKAGSQADTP